MKYLLIFTLTVTLFAFCSKEDGGFIAEGTQLSTSAKPFSPVEINYIMSGAADEKMRLFTIFDIPDSLVLRDQCIDVIPDSTDEVLVHLISRMYETVRDPANPGVGLAAPQVGINRNIIWVNRQDKPGSPFEVCLNPKITVLSWNTTGSNEGCLSIPGESHVIQRYKAILVEYYSLDGEFHRDVVEGYTAKIFQHEIDHLNGVLYIDYM
ncbi:MAG: peptide deformylase [Bacteroidales bacterium]|nr:peptide deformylase [Bacteroidales bacterium]